MEGQTKQSRRVGTGRAKHDWGYRLLHYFLAGTTVAHPEKKSRLLTRRGLQKLGIDSASRSTLFGRGHIAKPVLFERQWLVQYRRDGQSKVITFSGWEIRAALGIEPLDGHIQAPFHSKVTEAIRLMLDLVAMVPLIPCQVVELNEESPGPALARLPQVFLVVVTLLEMFPRLGEEPLEKILPADGGLRRDDVINVIIFKVGKGEGTMAPSMETGQERSLDSRMSARLLEICSLL